MADHESTILKLRVAAAPIGDRFYEWRFGIQSGGNDPPANTMDASCDGYRPTGYRAFWKVIQHVEIHADRDMFLDVGSGMGRVVLLAATHPFRKVIGVEITPELNAIAEENLRRIRDRLRCQEVDLVTADARDYAIPADVTVLYLWNPFFEAVLERVFEKLRQSIAEAPRLVSVLYVSPPGTPHLANLQQRLAWLTEQKRVPWGADELVIYTCGSRRE